VDPGEPNDRRGQGTTGVGEDEELLAKAHCAVPRDGQANRADLDDLLGLGLVSRRLDVNRDEVAVQISPI
jgi:hypothetical protein